MHFHSRHSIASWPLELCFSHVLAPFWASHGTPPHRRSPTRRSCGPTGLHPASRSRRDPLLALFLYLTYPKAATSSAMSTQRPTVALPGGPATQPDKGSLFGSVRSRLQRNRSSESSVSTLVESPTAEHPPSTPGAAAKLKTLFETIASPPPPAGGDGLEDSLVRAPGDPAPVIPEGASLWQQVTGGTVDADADVAIAAIKSGLDGPVNDREMLLERVVTMLQGLPDGSPVQQPITDALIKMLWDELHAEGPRAFVGPQYRSADGSGNSLTGPTLGAAGTPYARTVPPCHPKMPNAPDAGVVFDALLRRREFRPHPSGISCVRSPCPSADEDRTHTDLSRSWSSEPQVAPLCLRHPHHARRLQQFAHRSPHQRDVVVPRPVADLRVQPARTGHGPVLLDGNALPRCRRREQALLSASECRCSRRHLFAVRSLSAFVALTVAAQVEGR